MSVSKPEKLRLLNNYEKLTFEEIKKVTDQNGSLVYPKVRIADVLKINRSGLTDQEYTYALKAHFDFVICDRDNMPQFSVEFDGPAHLQQQQQRNDAIKNKICKVFDYPLLRINTNHVERKYRNDITLLAWIIDVYYLEKAFYEAQEAGHVPYDEPFDPFFIIASDEAGSTVKFPYWLSADVRINIQKLAQEQKIRDPSSSGFIGHDSEDNLRGIEFIRINDETGICIESGMHQQNFPGMFTDLFSEILLVQLFEKLKNYLRTGQNSEKLHTIYSKMKIYQSKFKMLTAHSCGTIPDA